MYYQAVFKKDTYNGKGTYLHVYVPGVDIQEKYFDLSGLANGMVRIDDSRTISAAQRGLIYSVFNDIRVWRGDSHKRIGIEKVKLELKAEFCVEANLSMFSLSNVSIEIASDFIDYLLDFTFINDIRLTLKPFEIAKTVRNWSYLCLSEENARYVANLTLKFII